MLDDTSPTQGDAKATKARGTSKMAAAGQPFSKTRQRQSKRDAVLSEAAQLFRRRGFQATSMDDIAEALGVTKGALYRYVKGKDEILFECYRMSEALGDLALKRADEMPGTAMQKLTTFFVEFIEGYLQSDFASPAMVDLDVLSPVQRQAIVKGRDRIDKGVRAIVELGVADGSIRPCEPKFVVLYLMSSVNWMPSWYSPDGDLSPAGLARSFADTMVAGLAAYPTP